MANALYDSARELFLEGGITWTTDTIKACLVDTGIYTVNLSAHQYLGTAGVVAAIVGGSAGRSAAFSSKTATGGAADAADVTFSAISGSSIEAIIIYIDSGVDNTSQLIAYIDTATGLPITPNGGDIIVTWDNGANKIFKL
jgi:hypothetical protein